MQIANRREGSRIQLMELPTTIMKFGGTSLADAERLRHVAEIIRQTERVAVVVSAAGGVTDELLALLEAAVSGRDCDERLTSLRLRHRTLLQELGLDADLLEPRFQELSDLIRGIELLREVTPRTRDLVLSYGEYLLAPVLAGYLASTGCESRAWVAGDLGLCTDRRFGRARPLAEADERIAATLLEAEPHVPVVTGFLGRTLQGEATTLGRGGSDYSASILARAVGAQELLIWTDVDGILTADPRVVANAQLIDRLSFDEASELAYSGAKVLHPSTITPAMERGIPVRVLNSWRPDHPGTTIVGEPEYHDAAQIRSIAHKNRVQVITVLSPRMLARPGFISRIAAVFDRHNVSIDMISTSEVSVSLTTDESPAELAPLLEDLEEFSTVRWEEARGMVSVVGAGLGQSSEAVGEVLATVARAETQVEMISYGATRLNLSFLVREERVEDVVRALHDRYFRS